MFVTAILSLLILHFPAQGTELPCLKFEKYIEVDTKASNLYLCKDGQVFESFKIAIGRGGIHKRAEGDRRTPIGTYALGNPRDSKGYITFIPIGYPTPDQKANGLTGKDVGVHGPVRFLSWLGPINNWFNWTNGCVAVGTAEEVTMIAEWVVETQTKIIDIH